MLLLRNKDQH